VKGEKGLLMQMRNVWRQPPERWSPHPTGLPEVALGYGALEMDNGVFAAMEAKLPMRSGVQPRWTLPELGPSPIRSAAPIALVRPVMRRLEWDNEARNPRPEYVAHIAADLKARGYAVVVVCDISPNERPVGGLPPHNIAFTNGEMTPCQLLATMRDSAVVVGGVGWIVPAAVALGVPTFVVLGGNGGMNAPEKLIDRRMPSGHIGFAKPERFCRCMDMHHNCDKTINDIDGQWRRWRSRSLPAPSFSRSQRAIA
jgi:hypothetical protein